MHNSNFIPASCTACTDFFTPAVMLNRHHLFYCETGSINATGFNSAEVLQVFNMQLRELLSVEKHIRIQRKQYVLIIYCKMYLSSKMKQVTTESCNEAAVGKHSQDYYSQVSLRPGNRAACALLNKYLWNVHSAKGYSGSKCFLMYWNQPCKYFLYPSNAGYLSVRGCNQASKKSAAPIPFFSLFLHDKIFAGISHLICCLS